MEYIISYLLKVCESSLGHQHSIGAILHVLHEKCCSYNCSKVTDVFVAAGVWVLAQ